MAERDEPECYIPTQPNAEARKRSEAIWREALERFDPRPVDCTCSLIAEQRITVALPLMLVGAWNRRCKVHGEDKAKVVT